MFDNFFHERNRLPPLILRREPFGGSLFDAQGACQIEFDAEACEFLRAHLTEGKSPENSAETELLAAIKCQMPLSQKRNVRFVEAPSPTPIKTSLHIFNAPTIIDFQITERCSQNCPHCYAASSPDASHLPMKDIIMVLDQIRDLGVFQLALGGGEPLEHPDIRNILRACHERGILCNLTTSGHRLSLKNLIALKRYCGAVGVSLEAVGERYRLVRQQGFTRFDRSLNLLLKAGIPTVLQVTLSVENLIDVPSIVDFCLTRPNLYGVIFLAYKPVGRGAGFRSPLSEAPYSQVQEVLKEAFDRLSPVMRVGYDCCLSPALVELAAHRGDADAKDIEGCSALRGSLGITAKLDVVPCTFLPDVALGNLKHQSLAELFGSKAPRISFLDTLAQHRTQRDACVECPHGDGCLGGCPKMPLVGCSRWECDREEPWGS